MNGKVDRGRVGGKDLVKPALPDTVAMGALRHNGGWEWEGGREGGGKNCEAGREDRVGRENLFKPIIARDFIFTFKMN